MRKFFVLLLFVLCATPGFAQLYDFVVAKDGSGDFKTIQEAVMAVKDYNPEGRQRILVKNGFYEEKVQIPSYKTNVSLIGENRDKTVLIFEDQILEGSKRSIYETYTMRVDGVGFECENMSIANNGKGGTGLAVITETDKVVFRNCNITSAKYALFVGNEENRQVYYKCNIKGNTIGKNKSVVQTYKRPLQRKNDAWKPNALPVDFNRIHFAFCDEYSGKGSAYKAGTLEPKHIPADPVNAREELVMNLSEVDCTTFVEYLSAALLSRTENPDANDSIMQRFVQAIRYYGGVRGNYATRKHYFTDWIRDNVKQGMMIDITETCADAVRRKKVLNFMSTHASSYPMLKSSPELVEQIKKIETEISAKEISYIPTSKIIKNYSLLQEGDIVAFVTSTAGLDVQHVGFVWRPDPNVRPQLFHASSDKGKVIITNATVGDYAYEAKNCIGIKIVRLKQ